MSNPDQPLLKPEASTPISKPTAPPARPIDPERIQTDAQRKHEASISTNLGLKLTGLQLDLLDGEFADMPDAREAYEALAKIRDSYPTLFGTNPKDTRSQPREDAEPATAQKIGDEASAESYPVTDHTRHIVEELQALQKLNESQWNNRKFDWDESEKNTNKLIIQLSDSLALPPGKDMATLVEERKRFEELKYDITTIGNLTGSRPLRDAELSVIIAKASPQIQAAYDAYKRTIGPGIDYEIRGDAKKALEKACDVEAGIAEEETNIEYSVGTTLIGGIRYSSAEKAQAEILQNMWKQIKDARTAQSVYERRAVFVRNLAAEAGLAVYKTQMGFATKPIEASTGERPATSEGARALVQEAIRLIATYDGKEYNDDNLRSPQVTEGTFARALPDASGLVVDRTRYGELGRGAVGTVFKAKARGGIPGLRGEIVTSEELPIAVKATTVDLHGGIDHSTAKWILSTIEEAHVLDVIRQKQRELYPGSKPFVIDSVLVQNYRGSSALVMEYVDDNYNIFRQRGKLTPRQLRSACKQYFQLQDVIHEVGFSCNDVKDGDVFYNADEDRLIVLDWNVTRPNSSPLSQENIQKMNTDLLLGLKIFGENMAQSWPPEAIEVFRSLDQRIRAQRTTVLFDAKEVVRVVEELPLAA